jgi:predicted amidohydrolase YtcJ
LRARSFSVRANRGHWILGFGWDQNLWVDQSVPHFKILDELFPENPVAFSRIDGHCLWVNSLAMKLGGMSASTPIEAKKNGRVELDNTGRPTGIFVDGAKTIIEEQIPLPSTSELMRNLIQGMNVFSKAGFTHIRDVGGSLQDWMLASEIEKQNELNIFCEMYFNLDKIENLSLRIDEIQESKAESRTQLRVGGLKLYFDGALGSEGAYLSHPYADGKMGTLAYDLASIEEIFRKCWEKNISIAIHTLGDEAVHQIACLARKLKANGVEGQLNLEHCEVVRPETIAILRLLNVRCHLQPSHFLTDKRWLKDKLGELYRYCFPWRNLHEAGIPINFGSDSPIELPSLLNSQRALDAAAQSGILLPPVSAWTFHSHPDGTWGRRCVTRLNDEGTVSTQFNKR